MGRVRKIIYISFVMILLVTVPGRTEVYPELEEKLGTDEKIKDKRKDAMRDERETAQRAKDKKESVIRHDKN